MKTVCVFLIIFLLSCSLSAEEIQIKEEAPVPQKTEEILRIEREKESEEASTLERLFSARYRGVHLQQFGYEVFDVEEPVPPPVAPVDEDYLLGPGDQLILYLWGDPVEILELESTYVLEVDREGRVFTPYTGPLYVAGKRLKDLKEELTGLLSRKFRKFKMDLSLSKPRTFTVWVTGAVRKPGPVPAQGTFTFLDVLIMAGGVSKEGSLRSILLRRKGGSGEERRIIDLYDLLLHGRSPDVKVRDGDVIHVPPVGEAVGVAGAVKRPAIYELKGETSLAELLKMAGGTLPSAYSLGVKILRYEEDRVVVYESSLREEDLRRTVLRDGDLVVVEEVYSETVRGAVRLEGFVAYPGNYSLRNTKTLGDLLRKAGLLPDTNMHYAELIRREPPDYTPEVVHFSPLRVLEGSEDITLQDYDTVRLYPRWVNPPIQVSGEVESPAVVPYYEGITLLDVLRNVTLRGSPRELKVLIYRSVGNLPPRPPAEETNEDTDEEGTEEDHYETHGFAELIEDMTARELLDLKARLQEELDYLRTLKEDANGDALSARERELKIQLAQIERKLKGYGELSGVFASVYLFDLLTRGEGNVELQPGDRVVVKRTEATEKDKTVTILGEVRRPGIYRLEEDMTLYDLIVKAGGYTPRAYPKGLIFIRRSARKLQEEHLEAALAALEESLAGHEEGITLMGAAPEERQALELTLRKQRQLLNLIKTRAKLGLGRIALEVPERLEELKESTSNIPLEDGDYVYIPPRPSYVLVIGGVYNQISLPYVKGKPLSFYLEQVGGLTEEADLDNIYVIKANGRVISRRNYDRTLTFEWRESRLYFARDFLSMPLEEGDTVVVPTKLRVPTMWRPLVRDVVQIIFQAISTAVLARRL